MIDGFASTRFDALGTGVVLAVTEPAVLPRAGQVLRAELARVDQACSRFRADSELVAVNASGGRPVEVSSTLATALAVALRVAAETDGVVDPTVGRAVRLLGYDRDFASLPADGPAYPSVLTVPGWRAVRLDTERRTVSVPRGVELDLGATAKAWCADQAAQACADATGVGVLVSLGGDTAVAGLAPDGGWLLRVCDRYDDPPEVGGPTVAIEEGGLATSSTTRRRWRRGGHELHHVLDPATGQSADSCWRTVSVAAATCAAANAASTAAIVLGSLAPEWLDTRQLPARLVAHDGAVTTTCGWPADAEAGVGR
ncbi:MAG TPA: FAD:protein FMN transferase [Acidimicrobiales bacterium]